MPVWESWVVTGLVVCGKVGSLGVNLPQLLDVSMKAVKLLATLSLSHNQLPSVQLPPHLCSLYSLKYNFTTAFMGCEKG